MCLRLFQDITQQRLCNASSVSLIEKCARFHIYCAERLCEEDMSVFDVKINNENLTKCLQSLKEMYHDLKVKHKVYCENEAEFRAYMVLMNLNQGDTLRYILKFSCTMIEPMFKFLTVTSNLYDILGLDLQNLILQKRVFCGPLQWICPWSTYCKTGNFQVRLIFANFATVKKTQKLIFVNIFAHHYNI